MDAAKELAEKEAEEGTVIIADHQTRGRGREGRTWESPEGGMYLSLVLRPEILVFDAHRLIFLSGNATAQAVSKFAEEKVEIKWPNDLVYGDKKIGGLLCETSSIGKNLKYAVLGIGVNTNISRFSLKMEATATSLLQETGNEVNNDRVAERILEEISTRYEEFPDNFPELVEEWRTLNNTLGRDIVLDGERLEAVDVDDEGFLIAVTKDGIQRRVVSGTIEYP